MPLRREGRIGEKLALLYSSSGKVDCSGRRGEHGELQAVGEGRQGGRDLALKRAILTSRVSSLSNLRS